jgi:hypothetical protein
MIEPELLNYGVLGLWTLVLLYEKFNTHKSLRVTLNELKDLIAKLCIQMEEKKK